MSGSEDNTKTDKGGFLPPILSVLNPAQDRQVPFTSAVTQTRRSLDGVGNTRRHLSENATDDGAMCNTMDTPSTEEIGNPPRVFIRGQSHDTLPQIGHTGGVGSLRPEPAPNRDKGFNLEWGAIDKRKMAHDNCSTIGVTSTDAAARGTTCCYDNQYGGKSRHVGGHVCGEAGAFCGRRREWLSSRRSPPGILTQCPDIHSNLASRLAPPSREREAGHPGSVRSPPLLLPITRGTSDGSVTEDLGRSKNKHKGAKLREKKLKKEAAASKEGCNTCMTSLQRASPKDVDPAEGGVRSSKLTPLGHDGDRVAIDKIARENTQHV